MDGAGQGSGGEGGIRTPGTLTRTLVFKTSAFNHSATSPTPPEHSDILRIWKSEDEGSRLWARWFCPSSRYPFLMECLWWSMTRDPAV